GEFIVKDKINYSISFTANYGQEYRFEKLPVKTNLNINGNWEAIFAPDSSDQFNAIGEFKQEGNNLSGTFRTETGDFRFLSGEISGNIINLSAFDGAHAFLFTGEVFDSIILGKYYSGKHYSCFWKARRMRIDNLIPADSLTKVIHKNPLIFKLPNVNNTLVSNIDPAYMNKPKVIQVTGTWCPNCREESEFLISYLKSNPNKDFHIIGIAFERYKDKLKGIERIAQYKKAMKLPYELLLGGNSNRDSSSLIFPQLDGIKGYPTLIFLDKNNRIVRVHTGFDGPATSKFEEFKNYFSESIDLISKL
ncbi:MAG: TlpA disulfide reductase family protein, partial [Saprospiraceae bacterium]